MKNKRSAYMTGFICSFALAFAFIPCAVIATGGISKYVIPMCRKEILYDRNLLLKGLAILYENNRR